MLDRQTAQIIHRCAAKLVGQAGIAQQDIESIRQDLTAHVLDKLAGYDPKLGHKNGFVSAVVQRRLISLLRSRQAEKRDHRRITSLNVKVAVEGETPTELGNMVSDRELDARLGRRRRSEQEIQSLASDMAKVIAELPPQWQRLLQLRVDHTMAEISKELGVPRTTLNSWMLQIRDVFQAAGLRDYLR